MSNDYTPVVAPGQPQTMYAASMIFAGMLVMLYPASPVERAVIPATNGTIMWRGIAGHDARSGDNVTVYSDGIQRLPAPAAGIVAGQLVEAAGAGGCAVHTVGVNDLAVIGLALTTTSALNLFELAMKR